MFQLRHSLIAVCASLAAGAATADTVRILGFTNGSARIDTTHSGRVNVGRMHGLLNGNSFQTYCTDIFETVGIGRTYDNYFVAPNGSAHGFSASQASMLGRLYTVADHLVNTRNESVAFQLAVWEILYENSGLYNVDNGHGSFFAQWGANDEQRSLANSWMASASTLTSSQYSVVRLASVDAPWRNDGRQDLMIATPIPEPSTYALMLGGLGVLAFVARRRRRG